MKFRSLAGLSLLWRILISTSVFIVLLFVASAVAVQRYVELSTQRSLENEVRTSAQAYRALWTTRTRTLALVSRLIASMSDVRAAFFTRDRATIRDSAQELWSRFSEGDALFLVLSPGGSIIASLDSEGADPAFSEPALSGLALSAARKRFPKQAAGYLEQNGHLFYVVLTPVYVEGGTGQALLNILLAGVEINNALAATLKQTTRGTDFVFLLKNRMIASTITPVKLPGWAIQSHESADPDPAPARYSERFVLASELTDVEGRKLGELRIIRSLEESHAALHELERRVALVWLLAAAVGLTFSYLLARNILSPVRRLDRAALAVANQQYDYRVPVDSSDEFGRLSATFNAMCDSIQSARDELIRQERITTIGRLTSSIVHDLRNPLAAIYAGAEMLVDSNLPPAQAERLAGSIYRASRRIQELLQDLLNVSRGKTGTVELCKLSEVVDSAYEALAPQADTQRVHVSFDVPAEIELPLERARVERLFVNLMNNALDAMSAGGELRVAACIDTNSAIVTVDDTGDGVPARVLAQLFQPFVSEGKKNGLGLGLALSRQTALDHGGDLWIDKKSGPGARFCVRFPIENRRPT